MKNRIIKTLKRAILAIAPLFLIPACEKPTDDLGFQQIIGGTIEADSMHIEVTSYTAPIDSILVALDYERQLILGGYNSTRLIGQTQSSYFGLERSNLVTQLLPEQVNADFGANPKVDSVNLYIRLTGAYGDTSQPMSLSVRLLENELSTDSNFYSNFEPSLAQELGRLDNYLPTPRTEGILDGELAPAHLRIPLDTAYFQANFADVGDGNFDAFSSFVKFREYFTGIKVSPESGAAILYSNLASAFSMIRIYYHNEEDTTFTDLNFDQDKSTVPINFSTFEHDYSNSSIGALTMDSINGEDLTYIQAMGGVTTAFKFDRQKIDSLIGEGLIINSAELEVYTAQGTGESVAPPSSMEIRFLEDKSLGDRILDFSEEDGGGGALRRGVLRNNKYVFNLSRHLFSVLNSGENNTLAIIPTNRSTAANRTILRGGSGIQNRATVIVYYTKP